MTTSPATDFELLLGAQRGDDGAFEELVRRYRDVIKRMAQRYGLQGGSASDVAQDTLLAVLRFAHRYEERGSFPVWLRAVARNVCVKYLKERGRAFRGVGGDGSGEIDRVADLADVGANLLLEELREQVARALETLREKAPGEWEAVTDHRDGLTATAAAEFRGIGIGSVLQRLHRGRKSLLVLLGREPDRGAG